MDDARTVVTWSAQPDAAMIGAWNDLVRNSPYADVAQLSAWMRVRAFAGFSAEYVFAHRGPTLLGGALVLTRRLPVVGRLGYVPYGPVIAGSAPRGEVVAALATALREATRKRLRMLFVQPPYAADDMSVELLRTGFRPSRAGIAPAASLRLDLTKSEDELRRGLRRRLQRWTRTWPARGVDVREGTSEDVGLLARFHAGTAAYQSFTPTAADYLQVLHDELAVEGHVRLLVGQVDGTPVAARLFTVCGGVVKDRFAGMDRSSEAARLNVPAAIYWEAIRWAKAEGHRWFDLGGTDPSSLAALSDHRPAASLMLSGSQAFKASFGAEPFRYPQPMERISSPVLRASYDVFQRWATGRRLVNQAVHLLRVGRAGAVRPDVRSR